MSPTNSDLAFDIGGKLAIQRSQGSLVYERPISQFAVEFRLGKRSQRRLHDLIGAAKRSVLHFSVFNRLRSSVVNPSRHPPSY